MNASDLVEVQLKTLFLLTESEKLDLGRAKRNAEISAMKALAGFPNKYLNNSLNPLNGVMYTNYLYWLSHYAYLDGREELAAKVYGLNKMLHSVDLFYAIELPEIWSCEHPLGAVMGRAVYGNRFFFYQGCTVGGNRHNGKLTYPVIGDNVMMYSNSKILGESKIGDDVTVAANTYIINEVIPDNSIVFGQSPKLVIKEKL